MARARPRIGERPFAVVLPDNLFRGPDQTSAVLASWDRYMLASALIAEVSADETQSKKRGARPGARRTRRFAQGNGLGGQGPRAVRHRRR
jgi:hypothetical protein